LLATAALVAAGSIAVVPPPAAAVSTNVVLSQVYGGGGNSGATYTNDFIELYNLGSTNVDLTGWSVQYASVVGTSWQTTPLSGTVEPAQYYLVQEAQGSGGTVSLPTPNATGSIPMSATAGKVALVANSNTLSGTCPTGVVDFVGFGSTANCYEGAGPTAAPSNTTSALRLNGGVTETDSNSADFTIGAPNPRNTPPPDAAPAVASTVPADGASSVPYATNITVTFSEPVNVTGAWFTLSCSSSGSHTAAVTGGPTTFTLNLDTDLVTDDGCTLTVLASSVSDQDSEDPPDTMAADVAAVFSTGSTCTLPFTPIYDIQGSGAVAAIIGSVATQGVVVGDYEGASPALRGFYLQDASGDGDPATSDGIFVFNGGSNSVGLGDVVRVSGKAEEYQAQTQLSSVTNITACGTGSVAPVDVTLPFASATYAERYEGMLVGLSQTLSVTETYQLGRFDEVLLSSGGRLAQPTNIAAPGAAANGLQAQNDLNQILVDDALNNQNPDPILFGRAGQPLSASNTLRGGDTATGIVGVMTYTWGGASASPNAYRVRPFNALDGTAVFDATNPRPTAAPALSGRLRVAGMNLLNFFNTFGTGACTNGVGGAATDCRGADNAPEFARQGPKTVAAITGTGADVIGVTELENDGYGPDSAIAFLVDQLNTATAPGTYAFIDADAGTAQTNALGTDAIKVGLLYKPAKVTPVGTTAALNSDAFVNGGDTSARNRAALAQAFEEVGTGARLVVNVNHLKSKGSACDAPDVSDGQGTCNAVRTEAATLLTAWLASDPTGTADPDALIVGDLNAYAQEDPITAIKAAGYTDLVSTFEGADAYSYVFDGQWGYLDHALADAALTPQVTAVADWHINADEPPVLDYNTNFKTPNLQSTLYTPDEFRAADHDPVLVDLDLTIPFPFRGFFSPVEPAPAFNAAKAGQMIPLKFSLGGDRGLDIFSQGPTVTPVACPTSAAGTAGAAMAATAASHLHYDTSSDQYVYSWKTDKVWAGSCVKLSFLLVDGTPHMAYFAFTK
jgi:Predicted extracellular nuclease